MNSNDNNIMNNNDNNTMNNDDNNTMNSNDNNNNDNNNNIMNNNDNNNMNSNDNNNNILNNKNNNKTIANIRITSSNVKCTYVNKGCNPNLISGFSGFHSIAKWLCDHTWVFPILN